VNGLYDDVKFLPTDTLQIHYGDCKMDDVSAVTAKAFRNFMHVDH